MAPQTEALPTEDVWAWFVRELQANGGLARDLAEQAAATVIDALREALLPPGQPGLSPIPGRIRSLITHCPPGRCTISGLPLLTRIEQDLAVEREEAEAVARVVFDILQDGLSREEIDRISAVLPPEVRWVWLPEAQEGLR